MANDCLPQIHACRMRVARLGSDGVPLPGANNLYVSSALSVLTFTPNITAGDEFEVKNGCGETCLAYKDCDRIKWLDVELQLCTPDPELHEILVGGVVLQNGAGRGYGYPRLNEASCPDGVSIEAWGRRVDAAGASDPTFPYAWWVLPRVYLQLGARTMENGPLSNPFTGHAIENPNWYDGPLNDWPDDSDRVAQWVPTDSMPEADCGYQTLLAS